MSKKESGEKPLFRHCEPRLNVGAWQSKFRWNDIQEIASHSLAMTLPRSLGAEKYQENEDELL